MIHLTRILSRREWGIIRYNAIFTDFAALFYVLIVHRQYRLEFLAAACIFLLFSIFLTGYGYLVNDLADGDLDRRHGKPNAFHGMPRRAAVALTLIFLLAGLLCALPFLEKPAFTAALLAWIFCSSAYSLPPLRWKEKGALGLAATVTAQQTLPVLLLFVALSPGLDWGALLFTIYATLRGLSSDLSHQIRDAAHDAQTGTRTFAVRAGPMRAGVIYALALECERLSTAVILGWMISTIPDLRTPLGTLPVSPIWPLLLGYLILLLPNLGASWRAYRQGKLLEHDPYNETRQSTQRDRLHLAHHSFPAVIVPLWLCAVAGVYYIPSLIFGAFIVLIFRLYRPALWRGLLYPPNHRS